MVMANHWFLIRFPAMAQSAEAARLGESMAFDLNPVAVLCMKTLIESAPQYGYVLIENIKTGLSLLSKRQRNGWKGII